MCPNAPAPKTLTTIGGSEAAAACGLDPHLSRAGLWLRKTGRMPPPETSEAMTWRNILQPVVLDALGAPPNDLISWEWGPGEDWRLRDGAPWMHGHPDGLFEVEGEAGILEIKTTNSYAASMWSEGIPAQPLLQVQHYLALTGLRLGMVACLIGGQRLVVRRCDRDEKIIAHMLRLEEEFVGFVERDECPPVESADAPTLAAMYPEGEGIVQLTAEDAAMVDELRARKRHLKACEADVDELTNKLKARMGEYATGVYEGRPLVRWSNVTANYPAREAETRSYRRFTLAAE